MPAVTYWAGRVSQVTAFFDSNRQYARKATIMLLVQLESTMRANEATWFNTDRRAAALKLRDAVMTVIKRYLAYRQRQADLAILCGMTERELKDVGLYRGDIDNLAT